MKNNNEAQPPNSAGGSSLGATEVDAQRPLRECINDALERYFEQLDGQPVTGVYDMVMSEVEVPLLHAVLRYTRNNQCRAAEVLGLNRGTLRKKIRQYDINAGDHAHNNRNHR